MRLTGGWIAPLTVALALGSGCSANDAPPSPSADDTELEEVAIDDLADLEIGDDEFIGDDTDFELTEEAMDLFPTANETEIDDGPDLEDWTVEDPELDDVPEPPADEEDLIEEEELDPDVPDPGWPEPGSKLKLPVRRTSLELANAKATWWSKRYDCAHAGGGKCECRA